jgi:hypothetical protein
MEDTKKITAAISAVMNYIKTEEQAVLAQASAAGASAPVQAVSGGMGPVKLWGMSGRQARMQMRTLMQMRTFK